MSNYLRPNAGVTITVAASDCLAVWSRAAYEVNKIVGYPNVPPTKTAVFTSPTGANTSSAFSAATQVEIKAGADGLFYETGTTPAIPERASLMSYQAAPGTLNATGTLTAALILGGIVTSTTAAAVTATLDTGAAMDIAIDLDVGDAFFWTAINTGGSNAFTVTAAASGHTIVGAGAVAANTSGTFLTRRTAADTYITYRV